jgi:hypothetical protein
MIRKISITLSAVLIAIAICAQQPSGDQRTTATKIADLLMQVPQQNSAGHNKVMEELSLLGEPAVLSLASSLVAPGKGNDTQFRYAFSGLIKFVAEGKNPAQMKTFSEAVCKALKAAKDAEVKDFLLQELQYVAGDEAIATVTPLLVNRRLSDPAARVMIRINTEASNKALMAATSKAKGPAKTMLVKALGEIRYAEAAGLLENLVTAKNPALGKAAMHSLARIAQPSSAIRLSEAAQKAGYAYDPADATGSYLLYLEESAKKGNTTMAENASQEIAFNEALPIAARTRALRILAHNPGEKSMASLMKALDSPNNEFRAAALAAIGQSYSEKVADNLRARLQSSTSPEHQAELFLFLAGKDDKKSVPFIIHSLQSTDKTIQLASIHAVTKLGHTDAINDILKLMSVSDSATIMACQEALLMLEGDKIADVAAEYLPKTAGQSKAALLSIIAKRKAERYSKLIYSMALDRDTLVRLAAARAVASVARPVDTVMIANLLNKTAKPSEIEALQDGFYAAIQEIKPSSKQVGLVSRFMHKTGAEEARYYTVLARIGGKDGLSMVEKSLKNGTKEQKEAAFQAITAWSDGAALPTLLRLSKESQDAKQKRVALASYINGVNRSENPADQKVLMLRMAMQLADTVTQMRSVISQAAQNPTLQSLVFVSKYLDHPEAQQSAVQAVRNIVMNNAALYGPAVSDIVNKAISLNKNSEAGYQREELMKHMAKLPSKGGFVKMFNETDLSGWKGLAGNPLSRAKMTPAELAEEQKKADEKMRRDWRVENGVLIFEGEGYDNLCSEKMYGDFELVVDWRMEAKGDGGVYLRGTPQVQTWDTSRVEVGAQVGSGGLYNNQKYRSKPLLVADNPIEEWNTFRITMIGDKVTVYLNGLLVTDNVVLENYWDRSLPIFEKEAIELQAHGTRLDFRDIYVREIPRPGTLCPPKGRTGRRLCSAVQRY